MTTATDEAALLAAICADPGDDTARLVYADWLQEHAGETTCPDCGGNGRTLKAHDGEPYEEWVKRRWRDCPRCQATGCVPDGRAERAEFIRAQIRSARDAHIPVVEAHTLLRRERELFRAHCDQWFPVPPGYGLNWGIARPGELLLDGRPHYEVSRGFVGAVTCAAADWLQHGDDLVAAHPVTAVRLTSTPTYVWTPAKWNREGHFVFRGDPASRPITETDCRAAGEEWMEGHAVAEYEEDRTHLLILLRCRFGPRVTFDLPG